MKDEHIKTLLEYDERLKNLEKQNKLLVTIITCIIWLKWPEDAASCDEIRTLINKIKTLQGE